ncbi:HlyC/CorC family transporter [Candidatus Falkowbacteria bacterium]|jgi:metal transporter CNNM|nr:HlyC/CorC family transporter [Candidatus Falkowbacteria bacterium]MBT4433166.1 HlyC/CorC family transporter [Candidatus Falkowbacteria bacterium]
MIEYFIILFLVFFSALFSGLTLGFFSLNKDDLERKAELGDEQAKKVYSVRKNGNLLLCTLLIGNVAVNSVLSIFLGSIASGFMAVLIATSLIVVFGEIIPQAAFSRYALLLGAKLIWLVKGVIFIFYPLSWPLAWALDKILGAEMSTVYSKKELVKLIEDHEDSRHSDIDEDEERILKGALSFSHKTVRDIMTPRVAMFSLPEDQKIDTKTVKKILNSGHSRIPVHSKNQDTIIGIFYVKDLIGIVPKNKTINELSRKDVIFVDHKKNLDDLLNEFKKTKHHLFIVLDEFGGVSGLVTIEDVLEEIIGAEIVDEFDKHEDLQKVAKQKMNKKKMNKV